MSPWVDRLLRELGHEVYVVNPRRVRLIAEATLKTDKVDAETLARLVRIDPKFLSPITHRSEESRQQRAVLRVRAVIEETRSKMISVVRGLVKRFGKRIPACSADLFVERFREFADQLDPAVVTAVTPLVEEIEVPGLRIDTADAEVKALASQREVVERLDEIPGIGELVAVAFVLCIDVSPVPPPAAALEAKRYSSEVSPEVWHVDPMDPMDARPGSRRSEAARLQRPEHRGVRPTTPPVAGATAALAYQVPSGGGGARARGAAPEAQRADRSAPHPLPLRAHGRAR